MTGSQVVKATKRMNVRVVTKDDASILVEPTESVFNDNTNTIVCRCSRLSFLGDTILKRETRKNIFTMRRIIDLVSIQLIVRGKKLTLGKTMEEGPTIIAIAPMKSEHKRNTPMIGDGGDFGCIPSSIERRRTNTITTKDVLNEGGVDDTSRRTRTYLKVNTNKIIVGMLEKMMFGP
jgi:hypothetical protein